MTERVGIEVATTRRIGCPRANPVTESGWSLRNWRACARQEEGGSARRHRLAPDLSGRLWHALAGARRRVRRAGRDPVVCAAVRRVAGIRRRRSASASPGWRGCATRSTRARAASIAPTTDSLLLFSDRVAGWRLADALAIVERDKLPLDISAVLALMRQLIPAVALFSRHQRDAAIGTIGARAADPDAARPSRASPSTCSRPASRRCSSRASGCGATCAWRLPARASPARIPPSADVVGIGVVTALAAPRPPARRTTSSCARSSDLLDSATETHARRLAQAVRRLSSLDRARAAVRREHGLPDAAGSPSRVRRDAREGARLRHHADAARSLRRAPGESGRVADRRRRWLRRRRSPLRRLRRAANAFTRAAAHAGGAADRPCRRSGASRRSRRQRSSTFRMSRCRSAEADAGRRRAEPQSMRGEAAIVR